jgi:hypothetical protein
VSFLRDALGEVVSGGTAVVWAGAGIASALSRGALLATWSGLVAFGLQRCVDVERISRERAAALQARARTSVANTVIVCQEIEAALRRAGEWERFWFDFNRSLRVVDGSVGRALAGLRVPLITTNYDSLLEQATGRRSVTWHHPEQIERVMSGYVDDVVHVHGVHDQPDTLVFGRDGYRKYQADGRVRATLQALQVLRPHVYIGCGGGLKDPYFRRHFGWLRATIGSSSLRHFRLCTESEKAELRLTHPSDRLMLVSYGRTHADLPGFLERLAPRPARERHRLVAVGLAAASMLAVTTSAHVSLDSFVVVRGRAVAGPMPIARAIVRLPGRTAPVQADANGEFVAVLQPSAAPVILTVEYGTRKVPFRLHLHSDMREVSTDLDLETATAGIVRSK